MSHILLAASTLVLAASSVSAAPIPPTGSKVVNFPFPAKAPIVVSVNGYDTVRKNLAKMFAAALPKEAEAIEKAIDEQWDAWFEARKLTAVRKDARVFLVLNDLAALFEEREPLSVLVPVTSHKDFLDSFLTKAERMSLDRGRDGVDVVRTAAFGEEQPAYLVDLKEYSLITLDRAIADAHAVKYTMATDEQMGNEPADAFLKADVAIYLNLDVLNQQFGEEIRAFKGLIEMGLQQAQQQGALDILEAKQIEAVKIALNALVKAIEDCRSVVASAVFKPEGLLVRVQALFAENSDTAKFLADQKPDPQAKLAKLPGGLGTYTAMKNGKALGEILRDLNQELVTTAEDARGAELIEKHLQDVAAAGPGAEFVAALPPGEFIIVTEYQEPDKAVRGLTKAMKAVAAGGRVNSVVLKTAPRVADEAEKHRGFTFSSVNFNFDLDASISRLPEEARETAREQLKKTVLEKSTQWIGSNGKVVIRMTAKDWEAAKVLLDRVLDDKGSVGKEDGFRRVREQLPFEANIIVVAEITSTVEALVNGMKSAASAIPGFPELGAIKKPKREKAAYVGLAISITENTATVTGFVPAAAASEAYKMLNAMLKKVE